jgi:hypothetical protein
MKVDVARGFRYSERLTEKSGSKADCEGATDKACHAIFYSLAPWVDPDVVHPLYAQI